MGRLLRNQETGRPVQVIDVQFFLVSWRGRTPLAAIRPGRPDSDSSAFAG